MKKPKRICHVCQDPACTFYLDEGEDWTAEDHRHELEREASGWNVARMFLQLKRTWCRLFGTHRMEAQPDGAEECAACGYWDGPLDVILKRRYRTQMLQGLDMSRHPMISLLPRPELDKVYGGANNVVPFDRKPNP